MKTATALFVLFLSASTINAQAARFHVIREWKFINFTWPSEEVYKTAQDKGLYIPENNVIAGVKYYDDHYYLTLPRMKQGVPATLARISAGSPEADPSPKLQPFPSWDMNMVGDCNSLQNVQNVEVDPKGQIWIIDGGRVETLQNPIVKCPPKLVVFDIKANRTTTIFTFPEDVASKNGSFLYDIVVDNTDGGFAYITDNSASDPGIIVFSVRENRAWKVHHARSMRADPSATQFTVNGISISAPINIAGIALGPKIHTSNENVVVNADREVFFSPLSSRSLYSINTTVLRNENLAKNPNTNYDPLIKTIGTKESQSVGMVMDNQGTLYYGLLGSDAIGKWDSHTPFQTGQKLIGRDDKYIEWPNSFTFDPTGNLTVVTNRLNKFIYTKLNLNEGNFRLIAAHVGGKSYLYDENYEYHAEEPVPEPSPQPLPPMHQPSTDNNRNIHNTTSPAPMRHHDLPSMEPSSASTTFLSIFSFLTASSLLFL